MYKLNYKAKVLSECIKSQNKQMINYYQITDCIIISVGDLLKNMTLLSFS